MLAKARVEESKIKLTSECQLIYTEFSSGKSQHTLNILNAIKLTDFPVPTKTGIKRLLIAPWWMYSL